MQLHSFAICKVTKTILITIAATCFFNDIFYFHKLKLAIPQPTPYHPPQAPGCRPPQASACEKSPLAVHRKPQAVKKAKPSPTASFSL